MIDYARETAEELAKTDWENDPIQSLEILLTRCAEALDVGSKAVSARKVQLNASKCAVCGKPIKSGRWFNRQTLREKGTGIETVIEICSSVCYWRHGKEAVAS